MSPTYLVETRSRCCGASWWIQSSDWACSVLRRVQRSAVCRPPLEWQATASCDCVWLHPNHTASAPHSPAWSWRWHPAHKHKSCGWERMVRKRTKCTNIFCGHNISEICAIPWFFLFCFRSTWLIKCSWIKYPSSVKVWGEAEVKSTLCASKIYS